MNEITPATDFQRGALTSPSVNAGAVSIEQERAIAEAQGQLILAKRFPRSMAAAKADLMEACKSLEFAAAAFYSVPNRGSGPSIRFMEEAARCYGNFQFGHRELSRSKGKSEVEVFAWDMEKNNRSIRQVTVEHTIDTKNGPKPCRDQSDIDNLIANKASKQVRGRIAALLPKDLIAAGVAECKKTLAGDNDEPISARVTKMVSAFSRYGVTADMLGKYVGHTLDTVTIDELADMAGVFNALREGAKASEYFATQDSETTTGKVTAADIAKQAGNEPATVQENSRQDDQSETGKLQTATAFTLEVPLKGSGVKDYAAFCRILADRLKGAGDIDTFNAWQTLNEREMDEAAKATPNAYASLQAVIDAKGNELLGGEG